MKNFRGLDVGGPFLPILGTFLRPAWAALAHAVSLSALSLLATVAAGAPGPGDAELTLDEAVRAALANNAQLAGMRAQSDAMAEQPAQARALPNPMFTYSGMDAAKGGRFPDTNEKRFMVQQEFPWFGKRGLREEVAQKSADVMRSDLEAMTREVVMMVKETYFELVAVQRVAAITLNENEVLKRMEKSAEAMNATGQRGQLDVLKAQSEVTMLMPRLLELEQRQVSLQAKLNTLMNRPPDAPIGQAVTAPADGFRADGKALLALAAQSRPEIQRAQLQVDRAEAEHRLMVKESSPDYKLGVELRDYAQGDDMVMFTLGLDLPLWRGRNRALAQESAMMVAASKAALQASQQSVANDLWDSQAKLTSARLTLALYQTELVPQAESRFRASEAAYQTGQADFLDLLESERFLLNARTMAAMAEGELGMSLARLERALGADLKSVAAENKP